MKINMVGILTDNFDEMVAFYKDVINMKVMLQLESHVEFEHEGVRFAISTRKVMSDVTGHGSYKEETKGQSFELAFEAPSPKEVDTIYEDLISKGAKGIKPAANMPWNQRTAFFADPDGNIHEVFANL